MEQMKTLTISTVIAGLTAGALTLLYTNPVKNLKVKNLTKKVRLVKERESTDNNDHLFI